MATQPCHHCGYDLTGIATTDDTLCPECGKTSPSDNANPSRSLKRARLVISGLALAEVLACFGLSYFAADGWAQMAIQLFVAPAMGAILGLTAFVVRCTIGMQNTTPGRSRIDTFGKACAWAIFTGFTTAFLGAVAALVASELNPGNGC
jgi:hypothetical protein